MSTTIEDVMYDMAMEEMHMEEGAKAQEEYEKELIDTAIKDFPEENVRSYLGKNGDAIEERVNKCLSEADELLKNNHPGLALVVTVTAIEIIFKYFILRPLFEGTLLTDKLAGILIPRLMPGQAGRCCELLPTVAGSWGIPLTDIKLSNDNNLWDTLKKEVLPTRNAVVHMAEEVTDKKTLLALECANILMKDVVAQMANKFGLSWHESGEWHQYNYKTEQSTICGSYEPSDPFKK